MGKSVRANISLPEELHKVYSAVVARSGISLPQVLVNALGAQSAYSQRWIQTFDFRPRDVVKVDVPVLVSSAAVRAAKGGDESKPLPRQQRRALERQQRKAGKS